MGTSWGKGHVRGTSHSSVGLSGVQSLSQSYLVCGVPLVLVPSVLWHCWLSGRKGIRPVKTEWWGAGVVICLKRCADLHMAQLMPLPLTVSCFSKIQIGFTFLVPAHLGSPGHEGPLNGCVCVCGRWKQQCSLSRQCCSNLLTHVPHRQHVAIICYIGRVVHTSVMQCFYH